MAHGGITLMVLEMLANEGFDAEADGMKHDLGNYPFSIWKDRQ